MGSSGRPSPLAVAPALDENGAYHDRARFGDVFRGSERLRLPPRFPAGARRRYARAAAPGSKAAPRAGSCFAFLPRRPPGCRRRCLGDRAVRPRRVRFLAPKRDVAKSCRGRRGEQTRPCRAAIRRSSPSSFPRRSFFPPRSWSPPGPRTPRLHRFPARRRIIRRREHPARECPKGARQAAALRARPKACRPARASHLREFRRG